MMQAGGTRSYPQPASHVADGDPKLLATAESYLYSMTVMFIWAGKKRGNDNVDMFSNRDPRMQVRIPMLETAVLGRGRGSMPTIV